MSRLGTICDIFLNHDCINNRVAPVSEHLNTEAHCVRDLHLLTECFCNIHTQYRNEKTIRVLFAAAWGVYSFSYDLIHVLVEVLNKCEKHSDKGHACRNLFVRVAYILPGRLVGESTPTLEQVNLYGLAQALQILLISEP